jgi:transcriptional regulator with XRE-family HTH domain
MLPKKSKLRCRLKVLRAEYGISQREVAEALECYSEGYVSLLENDKARPNEYVIKKLCGLFDCKPHDIFPATK